MSLSGCIAIKLLKVIGILRAMDVLKVSERKMNQWP
jgi:hypothetical protein